MAVRRPGREIDPAHPTDPAQVTALLLFRLGDQFYGLPIDAVMEVMPIIAATPVPRMPDDWLGIANIRGVATPIVDLRARLGLETMSPSLSAPLVVLRGDRRQLAVLVDVVEQIVSKEMAFTEDQVSLHDGRLVVVLNPDKLFEETPKIEGTS